MLKDKKKPRNENLSKLKYVYMYLRHFILYKLLSVLNFWTYQPLILIVNVIIYKQGSEDNPLIVEIIFLLIMQILVTVFAYMWVKIWNLKYIYIGKTLKVSKCTKKVSMSEKAKLQGYSMSRITNLFKKDFKKVYSFAKEKQWKSIKTSTHDIFVLEIFKGIGFKTEDIGCEYKQILKNLQSDNFFEEWKLQDTTLKIKKDRKMINRALVFTLGYKPTFEQLNDYCKIRQFYKVDIILSQKAE